MECRKINITLVSATDLPDVRTFLFMKAYAKVSIKGESKTTKKTPVDMKGETNPAWNFPVEYTIGEKAVQKQGVNINIRLFCRRSFGHDRFIGEVNVSISSLFDGKLGTESAVTYPVAGTPNGKLNLLYSFGEKFVNQKILGWERALMGFFTLVEGVLILLGTDDDNSAKSEIEFGSTDVDFERTEDGVVFHDTRSEYGDQ